MMPGRGYLLAISEAQAEALRACRTIPALERWVAALRGSRDRPRFAEVDKAWSAIHRCLAVDHAREPRLAQAFPATPERETIPALLVPAEAVTRVSVALEAIDEAVLRARFFATLRGEPDDDSAELDFLYTWQWFQRVRELYRVASADGRAVLFTVGDPRSAGAGAGPGSGEGWTLAGGGGPARRLA
jgi:hypothetical protein